MQVLHKFLTVFSKFDWDQQCLSLRGPIPLSTFPNPKRESASFYTDKNNPNVKSAQLCCPANFKSCLFQQHLVTHIPGRANSQRQAHSSRMAIEYI